VADILKGDGFFQGGFWSVANIQCAESKQPVDKDVVNSEVKRYPELPQDTSGRLNG